MCIAVVAGRPSHLAVAEVVDPVRSLLEEAVTVVGDLGVNHSPDCSCCSSVGCVVCILAAQCAQLVTDAGHLVGLVGRRGEGPDLQEDLVEVVVSVDFVVVGYVRYTDLTLVLPVQVPHD